MPAQPANAEQQPDTLDACRRCDLWRHATQPVGGQGARHARLMLVGEQPGAQEDVAGKPFVGPAGDLLDDALAAAGIDGLARGGARCAAGDAQRVGRVVGGDDPAPAAFDRLAQVVLLGHVGALQDRLQGGGARATMTSGATLSSSASSQ